MYITYLILVINQEHGCAAIHRRTFSEAEAFHLRSVLDGPVEVFQLVNHPKATWAYAWAKRKPHLGADTVVLLVIPSLEQADPECRIFNSPRSHP